MKVYAADRQQGKTERVIEWLSAGKRTDSYPFWSRVLIVPTYMEAERLRKGVLAQRFPDEDVYRWVFALDEWATARLGRDPVEIAVDNADYLLASLLGQAPAVITVTGESA